ncbi:PREDICTED: ankyrin repeat and zinc finger domain-containing protein 1-like [Nicrophorus vespilloides]|uniref:Ankyrin repeat and zinc finger domain-containing protein 1-like n=1 Tax=Nicrophorus vespilloides TaxID=110193 RepID=A0ABM1NDT3_NICVS|nr:PREDICTED: ankyrin repeat and zinc finger domain-containing protein 1-like [Nicrophorus vespilloides]XP_017784984.1 PREDICTED: ankyrin repeat and zinc finger domain-containing protein 1-like [Nicrophorus vespilloides]XP_017784985.1 PREDICTED: ankyrin repeat and zinc finger domain-containing protein 1-like [Nicrophorus vespilloides]
MDQIKVFDDKFKDLTSEKVSPVALDGNEDDDLTDCNKKREWQAANPNHHSCSFCRVEFPDIAAQREHYKLDWHRYNLKQNLLNREPVNEEEFNVKLADDLSSISGSDSEKEDVTIESLATAQGKIFLRGGPNGVIFSLYRCLLAEKKVEIEEGNLQKQLHGLRESKKWTILMLGGGHFAGAIFDGEVARIHKTFHCYTVRAGQGGSQSSRDNKNASSAPKSAGASLRRYNETALIQHVGDIIETWKEDLEASSLIFIRAAGPYNKSVLFGGKNPLLERSNPRIRTIPFSTRRATFTEVKRVHSILSTIYCYNSTEDATKQFIKQKSPNHHRSKGKNTSINRAKSRENIQRPLPTEIIYSEEEKIGGLIAEDVEISFTDILQPFEETERRKKRLPKKKEPEKKKGKTKAEKLQEQEIQRKREVRETIRDGNLDKLKNIYKSYEDFDVKLHEALDELGNCALHVSAMHDRLEILSYLLENGANLCSKNNKQQTPYSCSQIKNVRDYFKLYAIEHPDKFNYNKAQIPTPQPSDLSPEELAEKKRLQRKCKRDKEKEKKKEKIVVMKERVEQDRFANLSDREKRALAAERRILSQSGEVISRCFLCGSNIAGKVPFEYMANRFCTIDCLKAHRMKSPLTLS